MGKVLFKGWSTSDVTPKNTNINFYDIDIIKKDLINEFMTRKGERVMMPNYGCICWDLIMEPLIDSVISDIEDDAQRIISDEPRVKYNDIIVTRIDDHTLSLDISLTYIPTITPFNLSVNFDNSIIEYDLG